MSLCTKDENDYRPVMSCIIHDYLFECPTRRIAHLLQERSQAPVYVYEFAHPSRNPRKPPSPPQFIKRVCYSYSLLVWWFRLISIYSSCFSVLPSCDGLACHANELPYPFQQLDVLRQCQYALIVSVATSVVSP